MQFMVDCHKKGKGNGIYKQKAQTARAQPGFLSMKNAQEYCYPPPPAGWDVSPAGLPPAVCCPYQFIHVHLCKVRQSGVKFLVYRNNANGTARKPGPLDPEFHL